MSKVAKDEIYSWVGSQEDFVDEINIHKIKHIVLGRFGGNSSAGQYKNEDGCIVWINEELKYEFVVLLDAHQTAESAELVIFTIHSIKEEIKKILTFSPRKSFDCLSKLLLSTFESSSFKEACKNVQGETAFLCVVRKDKFLWWFSVGDCILHLNHPELSDLNEYQQNHRSFYEWIGKVNTFELEVPCFSTGTKELRQGRTHLFLTTDGLVECPNVNFINPIELFKPFKKLNNEDSVWNLLDEIKENNVRDSTTIVSWFVDIDKESSQSSK
ncbi:protein phosphatase 2C domain-containing protein [Anaerobacillus isosaccharinicus]|uniref:Protein phosphatase n=1 Tax=Anaerobacillus isosaccharinicus TaxID=1532552 RepID=A0A1S2L7P2_9BACI|nr:protein phosphatase 2C domain-containing protein [Anaerobacillus isosaccharinicus]MBA5586359.1 protein phosphatase 2C domain-containing protein [Anaerobacillus isosaccharinicus]QOY35395.1 protein phosphatase 2C domain-containing protein [Anaerobacillus isosaccharinicus]